VHKEVPEKYYVVRIGQFPKRGSYVTWFDGENWGTSSQQRMAARFRDWTSAELLAVGVGDARLVCVRPRSNAARTK
jgi:hypothetical protein